jgi:ADP-ribosylglycohydrolase
LKSNNLEDAIRNAISIGGNPDTIATTTGSTVEAFYQKEYISSFETNFNYFFIDSEIEELIPKFNSTIASNKFNNS